MCKRCNLMSRSLLSPLQSTGDFSWCSSWVQLLNRPPQEKMWQTQRREVGSYTFQLVAVVSGKSSGGKKKERIRTMRRLLFVSTLSHLSCSCGFLLPPPRFLLLPWKDLVIPVGSKCDISQRSNSPTLPPPLPPGPSLRSVCFGPCHHRALCGSSHDGGEPSLANYHTPDESQRERDRERGVLRYFWPLTTAP